MTGTVVGTLRADGARTAARRADHPAHGPLWHGHRPLRSAHRAARIPRGIAGRPEPRAGGGSASSCWRSPLLLPRSWPAASRRMPHSGRSTPGQWPRRSRAWVAGDEAPALAITPRTSDVDTAAQTELHAPLEAATPAAAAPASPARPHDRPSGTRRPLALPMSMVAFVLAALLLVVILSSATAAARGRSRVPSQASRRCPR